MSADTKEQVKRAKQFFKEVSEKAERYQQIIPDKKLGEKLRKVSEGSKKVVQHIAERSE